MFIQTRLGFRQLRFVSTGLTDFHQFLVERRFYSDSIAFILEYLGGFRKWDIVYLDQINDEDSLYKYLENNNHSKRKYRIGCPIIDIDGLTWDEYISNIKSGNLRKDYRRKSHKLERETDPEFVSANKEEELKIYIGELFRLHVERWLYEGENSKFKADDLKSFMKEVLPLLIKEQRAILYVLKDGSNLVSYRLGFTQNRIFYDWNTSFDTKYVRYSPGKIITGYVIKDLIESGYRTFNFMRGDYEYKKQWMHRDREHVSGNYLFIFAKNSLRGKILERYYLNWRDNIKERFEVVINNKHFRSMLRLNKQ